ncbi:hypothetical protein VMCG_06793 [Cytospora schulzeri]|uniref:DUF7600 domain-containing protein n=1 Tax=Cytospora schulzeri TaxID=448051 RepID=A0A423W609_9PEZI|nr:hypothetical protein VMCG_06793 [Valsa malicola]
MAIQTRPFNIRTEFPEYGPNFDVGTDLLVADRRFFNNETDLGRLAQKLSAMPLEIQSQVLDGLGSSLFIALLKARTFSWQILPRIHESTTLKPTTRILDTNNQIKRIYGRSNIILGWNYLTEISFNDDVVEGGSSSISVADSSIRGLRFALGKFGLRGIQIIYEDGSCSLWLGDPSSCWIGVLHGRDLSKLRVIADDVRIIKVDFGRELDPKLPSGSPALWYGDHYPPEGSTLRFFTSKGATEIYRLHYYPGWRQCQYLPLLTESEYATGLTVYLWGSTITGIASHGTVSSNLLIGSRSGLPIHFALNKGERLTSVWLFESDVGTFVGRYLAVTTSHGRTKQFAPFDDSRQRETAVRCRWIQVSSGQMGPIIGIFIDLVKYSRGDFGNIIGFAQSIEHQRDIDDSTIPAIPEIYAAPAKLPRRFRAFPGSPRYILSSASLKNVSNLRIRRHDGRCIGLLLRYNDLTAETLGQWDPFDEESITPLYDAADGVLMRLNFHVAREVYNEFGHTREIMKDITVEVTDSPWEYQALENQPARVDSWIETFDCYRPKQGEVDDRHPAKIAFLPVPAKYKANAKE